MVWSAPSWRGSQRGGRVRAGFHGRMRGPAATKWEARADQDRPPSPTLGHILHTITLEELDHSEENTRDDLKISGCEYVASFSWLNSKEPTILVPGKPRLWKPLANAVQLQEDIGEYFRDPNAARFPTHPTEPALRAILQQNPIFACHDIDLFACGSTIGNLLRFIRKSDKPFRFIVEIVGNTAFFVRRENSPTQKIPDVYGYGHSFPDAYSKWEDDVGPAESHQRLIQYTFAGLTCIIRSQTDGYLEPKATGQTVPSASVQNDAVESNLTIRSGGCSVPQGSIYDLKTRTIRKKHNDTLSEEMGRLWMTQTSNFILAHHESGTFRDIEVIDVRDAVVKWEADNSNSLGQLASLICKIITLAKETSNGRCEIRRHDVNSLEVREQNSDVSAALPAELTAVWAAGKHDHPSTDSDDEDISSIQSGEDKYCLDKKCQEPFDSDDESEKDFTACSEDCGYCGRCRY